MREMSALPLIADVRRAHSKSLLCAINGRKAAHCWAAFELKASRYWPALLEIALLISSLTAERLKLAPGCMGGKSIAVCASFATSC